MAFTLKGGEDVSDGLRRLALSQVSKAQRALSGPTDTDVAIHECRKAIKRIRALLRFARPLIGEKEFRRENVRFRDIARLLSRHRDRAVMQSTVRVLLGGSHPETAADAQNRVPDIAPAPADPVLRTALEKLSAHLDTHELASSASHRTSEDVVANTKAGLKRAERSITRLSLPEKADIADTIESIKTTYRDGRGKFRFAYAANDEDAFHEWRKDVQRYWRQLALLRVVWPQACDSQISMARDLARLIGTDHDLAVLRQYVDTVDRRALRLRERRAVLQFITDQQAEIRSKAHWLGGLIYAEKPSALAARMRQYCRLSGARRSHHKAVGGASTMLRTTPATTADGAITP